MSQGRTLQEAAISANAVTYYLACATLAVAITIVGIPLLLIILPISYWYWSRYYQRLRVILTTRELKVHRGIFIREEKSIPLEKITDLAVFQGPIMRHFGLKGIRVETAGQTGGQGALVSIVGIEHTDAFRDLVLAQRDKITDRAEAAAPAGARQADGAAAPADGAVLGTLNDIRDTLRRIESRLAEEVVESKSNPD